MENLDLSKGSFEEKPKDLESSLQKHQKKEEKQKLNPTGVIDPGTIKNEAGKENSPLHFFMYLVSFFALLVMSTGIGAIVFQLINKNFTDNLRYDYSGYFAEYAVKYGIASVLITAPLYFGIMYLITKHIREGKISEDSKVRKWLTYIILFLTAATIIGDLVTLVFRMLDGDILIRFTLKMLTVLLIAGAIFGYYMWDMRKKNMEGIVYAGNKIFFIAGSVVALVVFLSAFFVVDSPGTARDKKFDSQTISYVRTLKTSVENYYRKNGQLPPDLDSIEVNSYYQRDAEKNEVTYEKVSSYDYKLCSDFRRSNMNDEKDRYDYSGDEWKHNEGNHCFSLDVKDIVASRSSLGTAASGTTAQLQAKNAKIKIVQDGMANAISLSNQCKSSGGNILSGAGGQALCSDPSMSNLRWPTLSVCGNVSVDTMWVVKNGSMDTWDFTVVCKNLPDCNGPANALCNKNQCSYSGTCIYMDESMIRN